MCFGVKLFGFILLGTLSASWTWLNVSFPRLGKFSPIISPSNFSAPFSLFSSWVPCNVNVNILDVIPEVSYTIFTLKNILFSVHLGCRVLKRGIILLFLYSQHFVKFLPNKRHLMRWKCEGGGSELVD